MKRTGRLKEFLVSIGKFIWQGGGGGRRRRRRRGGGEGC